MTMRKLLLLSATCVVASAAPVLAGDFSIRFGYNSAPYYYRTCYPSSYVYYDSPAVVYSDYTPDAVVYRDYTPDVVVYRDYTPRVYARTYYPPTVVYRDYPRVYRSTTYYSRAFVPSYRVYGSPGYARYYGRGPGIRASFGYYGHHRR